MKTARLETCTSIIRSVLSDTSRGGGLTEQRAWKHTFHPGVSIVAEVSGNDQEHEIIVLRSWVVGVDFYGPVTAT